MTSLPLSAVERTPSPAEALDLALAVAHPTRPWPFLLDADNAHAGTVATVAEAHAAGTAYALTVAPDVLAFDLDIAAHIMAGNALRAELDDESWPTLRTTSGRDGHRHLWTVVPDPADRARITERATELGLPRPRQTMRPPGVPHRLGLPVEFLDDRDDFLAAVTVARAAADVGEHFDWRDLLATGRWPAGWTGRDRSGSVKVWLVCIGAIRAGHQLDDVRAMLADPDNRGGAAYRARLGRADFWLDHSVWPKAVEKAAERLTTPADATEARHQLDALRAAVEAHQWPGKGGATDRAALSKLIDRGTERGSLTPVMSVRELADAVPCSRNTASASTRRLVAAGWLQVADRGRGRTVLDPDGLYREQAQATRWRLLTRARVWDTGGTPPAGTPLSVQGTREPLEAPRATRRRLPVARTRTERAPRPRRRSAGRATTDAELSELLNLNRGNLRHRLLPRLAAYGLVTRTADGWALVPDVDAAMEAAAELLDLTGKADQVAAEHRAERAAYLDHREHLRGRREQTKDANIAAAMAARRERAGDQVTYATHDEIRNPGINGVRRLRTSAHDRL